MNLKIIAIIAAGLSAFSAPAQQRYTFTNSAALVQTQRLDLVSAVVTPPLAVGGKFQVSFTARAQTNPPWAGTLTTYLSTNALSKVLTNADVKITYSATALPVVMVSYEEIATNYNITVQAARAIDWYSVRTNALQAAIAKLLNVVTNH